MPGKMLFRLSFAAAAALLSAAAVSAQIDSCAVKIDVTRNASETAITGATAVAVNSENDQSYKSSLRGGMPYFRNLPKGKYRITVARTGYMRSADDFVVSCADDVDSFGVELFRGNSAKTVKLYDRRTIKAPPLRRAEASVYEDSSASRNEGTVVGLEDENIPPKPVVPKVISGGVVNGKATNLVKPAYPRAALAVRASGAVNVQVTIDEKGNVISAAAVSGHPLLRAAAVSAARQSKFAPTVLSGQPVKVTGVIVYNFVPPEPEKEP
jgi:TonB family protein